MAADDDDTKRGLGRNAVIGLVVVLLAIAALSLWGAFCGGNGWEDYPEWLSALSTFGALLAASIAAVLAGRAFQLERGREDRYEIDRAAAGFRELSSQANLVAAWFVPGKPGVYGRPPSIHVANRSNVPIYNVEVTLYGVGTNGLSPDAVPVVPPTDLDGLPLPVPGDPEFGALMNWAEGKGGLVEITFWDAARNRWTRGQDGKLDLLHRAVPPQDG